MNPTNVPNEVLEQAKLVRAQLLVHMHTPSIIQMIQETYNVIIEIWSMQTWGGKLFVQVDLLDTYTEQEMTTFHCLVLKPDIVQKLTKKVEETLMPYMIWLPRMDSVASLPPLKKLQRLMKRWS